MTTAQTERGDVRVTASYGAFTAAAVPFRVWYPSSIAVHASDTTLSQIAECVGVYQRTDLRARATLLDTVGGVTISGVDVTEHTTFTLESSSHSSDTSHHALRNCI